MRSKPLTPFIANCLLNLALNLTLIHWSRALRFERLSVLACVKHARIIHSLLERVTLPAESVVGMRPKALGIPRAEDERLRAVSRPWEVVELSCIPQGLVSELGHPDWVRRGTSASVGERISCGVEHVRLMVRRVDVLSIPATGRSI
jgi:hypothetical protein